MAGTPGNLLILMRRRAVHGWARWTWTWESEPGSYVLVLPGNGCQWPDSAAWATVESRWIRQQHHPTGPCHCDQFRNVTSTNLGLEWQEGPIGAAVFIFL